MEIGYYHVERATEVTTTIYREVTEFKKALTSHDQGFCFDLLFFGWWTDNFSKARVIPQPNKIRVLPGPDRIEFLFS